MERYELQSSPMNNWELVQHTGDLSLFSRSMQEDRVTLETGVSYVYLEEDGGWFKRTPASLATPYVVTPALARAHRASRSRSPPLLRTYTDHPRAGLDSTLRWQTCQDEVERLRGVVADVERQIAEFKGQKYPQRREQYIDLRDLVRERELHAEKEGLLRKVQVEEDRERRTEHEKERGARLEYQQDVEWTHKDEVEQQQQARCRTTEAQEQEQLRLTAQQQKDEDASSPACSTIMSKEPYFSGAPSLSPTVLLTKARGSGATKPQK
jgi:hypothetical protein